MDIARWRHAQRRHYFDRFSHAATATRRIFCPQVPLYFVIWASIILVKATSSGAALGAIVIACSIGLARVYVGLHYPADILGGAFDGLLAALVVTVLYRLLHQPTNAVLRFAQTLHVA